MLDIAEKYPNQDPTPNGTQDLLAAYSAIHETPVIDYDPTRPAALPPKEEETDLKIVDLFCAEAIKTRRIRVDGNSVTLIGRHGAGNCRIETAEQMLCAVWDVLKFQVREKLASLILARLPSFGLELAAQSYYLRISKLNT